jgi:hypothetical protein
VPALFAEGSSSQQGDIFMAALAQVQINPMLTNIAVAYQNSEFVADQVFPDLPVDLRTDRYWVYDPRTFLQASGLDSTGKALSLRKPTAPAREVNFSLSRDQYYAEEYAKKSPIADETGTEIGYTAGANAVLNAQMDTTEMLTEQLKVDREMMSAYRACRTSLYPNSNKVTLTTGGSGTSWASYASANSNPFSNLRDAKVTVRKKIMREPNSALYTVDTAQTLADHPLVKDLIKYTSKDALSSSGLPVVLRGLRTIEAASQAITTNEGATNQDPTNCWVDENGTNVCLVFYSASQVGPRTIHFGRTFQAPHATTKARGLAVMEWRDENIHSMYVEASMTMDIKHIAVDSASKAIGGYLISGCTL